jgi:translation initiation factor 1 (eIF-1/SUI1)
MKRDKTGRFSGKSSKQTVKKKQAKKVKIKVHKAASKKRVMSIDDLTFYDLKDMISAEVALQMRY